MGGRITVESVVRCLWNGWPDDRGIRNYHELSNGGFYMTPTGEDSFQVSRSNYFEGELSAEAVGIMVSLAAIMICWGRYEVKLMGLRYENLIDFARDHAEWPLIRAALD